MPKGDERSASSFEFEVVNVNYDVSSTRSCKTKGYESSKGLGSTRAVMQKIEQSEKKVDQVARAVMPEIHGLIGRMKVTIKISVARTPQEPIIDKVNMLNKDAMSFSSLRYRYIILHYI